MTTGPDKAIGTQ